MIKILICDPISDDGIEELKRAGFEIKNNPQISNTELKKIVSNYDALIVRSRTKISKEIIEAGKNLKVIGRAGVGLDNIDLETAEKRGIVVLNTPEACVDAVSELTIGLIISLTRNISIADRTMKEGKWIKKELKARQLKDKTLGIIGFGKIGQKVARIAKVLGMKIIITKRTKPSIELLNELKAEFIPINDLTDFLQKSDVITIHIPLTSQTRHLIGTKEIKNMKEGAFLINTSRGGIVDETSLLKAVKSGKLGGVGLDVYENEPPVCHKNMKLPNVICTPHIGGQTLESQRSVSKIIGKKIVKFFEIEKKPKENH
jgi:D-3-phosphoglycerate dehydrogenase